MTITQQLKLNGIDIAGLNPDDRSRIEAIGLDAWLDEQSKRTRRSDRAKHKLAWFRKAGYDLDVEAVRCPELSKTDLRRFFSEVTDNELKMSNREFYSLWTDETAEARRADRVRRGYLKLEGGELVTAEKPRALPRIKKLCCHKCGQVFKARMRSTKTCPKCKGVNDPVGVRLCASGEKCLKVDRVGTPAPAAPGKQFCSDTCHEFDRARQQRLMASLKVSLKTPSISGEI